MSDRGRFVPLPSQLKPLHDVERENPQLRRFMKKHSPGNRYAECGVLIISQPQTHPDCQIYGYFLIDRGALRSGNGRPIKQDFVVYYRNRPAPNAVHYRGLRHGEGVPGELEDIQAFCAEFGQDGSYGCRASFGTWTTTNHEYSSTGDGHFPVEPELRAAVDATIARIRGETSGT